VNITESQNKVEGNMNAFPGIWECSMKKGCQAVSEAHWFFSGFL